MLHLDRTMNRGCTGALSAQGLPSLRPQLRTHRRQRAACRAPAALLGAAEAQLVEAVSSATQAAGLPSSLDHLAARVTSSLLALGEVSIPEGAAQGVQQAASAVASSAEGAQAAASTAVQQDNGGIFGIFTGTFETILKLLYDLLHRLNVPYAYGFAIILLTILVKAVTLPLSRQQVASTVAVQALQPRIKEIQARYKGKPQDEMQVEIARLYKEANVNPLAGCLPTLATIPVWIGLYRAFSNAADEGLLNDGWFWIPSLAGPTTAAAQKAGTASAWLFPFVNGAPPVGWGTAAAYLVLPALLVVSQAVTQRIMSPPSDDPSQKTTQNILQFLPLMIGYFALNVPSGLTLYWFTNNCLSTAQQYWLKNTIKAPEISQATPVGFVPPRPSRSDARNVVDTTARVSDAGSSASSPSSSSAAASNGSGGSRGKKGDKFRALKAKEDAKKAAAQVGAVAAAAVQIPPPAQAVPSADEPAKETTRSNGSSA